MKVETHFEGGGGVGRDWTGTRFGSWHTTGCSPHRRTRDQDWDEEGRHPVGRLGRVSRSQ